MPRRVTRVAAAVLCGLLAMTSSAQGARTDVIVLKNGDRLTGEVTQMRRGKLTVKTDDAGTLSIEWDKVASVTTADQYELVLRDGSTVLGRLRPDTPGSLQVVPGEGGVPASITIAEVASFSRIKSGFVQRIDGSLDLGGTYTKSSGVGDLVLNVQAKYRRPSYAFGGSLSANLTRRPDAPATSRFSQKLSHTRYGLSGWLVDGLGFFESNRDLGFTFRGTGAVSVGRYLARSGHLEFLLAGGIAAGRETPVDLPPVTNLDALVVMDLSVFTYDSPTTSLDFALLVFPSLDDAGRVRVNADGKFKQEIVKDFFVSLTAYDAFDNRPKAFTAKQNDFGASLSFGWSF